MKRSTQMIIVLMTLTLVIGMVFFQSQRTIANRLKLSRPPSYPFEEARKLAEAKLPLWIESMTGRYDEYGFKSEEEAQRATLGVPYLSYACDLAAIADEGYLQRDFRDTLEGGTNIEFPVVVDGEARTNISVVYRNHVWDVGIMGGYRPEQMVKLQKWLAANGITERVDLLAFNLGWATFGMIDYQGETMLIPLQDEGKYFPTLEITGEHMYPLKDVLPLIHEQSKVLVAEYERQNSQLPALPTADPAQLRPTEEPVPPTLTPAPPATVTPLGAP